MREVLISIQPKWVEKIVRGEKTVEVRKTKPKVETPFKCYIYCTKDNTFAEKTLRGFDDNGKAIYYKANKGKVIGEFVCDRIVQFENSWYDPAFSETSFLSCVGWEELAIYIGKKDFGYGWHITDLVVYDKPRELEEFCTQCKEFAKTGTIDTPKKCYKCRYQYTWGLASKCRIDGKIPITRPPQSWCYIEPRHTAD